MQWCFLLRRLQTKWLLKKAWNLPYSKSLLTLCSQSFHHHPHESLFVVSTPFVDRTCQNLGSSRRHEIWRRCKQCISASKWIDPGVEHPNTSIARMEFTGELTKGKIYAMMQGDAKV